MNKKQFIQLLRKYRKGKATAEECRFIESYYELFATADGKGTSSPFRQREQLKNHIQNEIWNRIRQETADGKVKKMVARRVRMAAAAILVLGAGIAAYLISGYRSPAAKSPAGSVVQRYKNDVAPGGTRAVLTLANGESIRLDSISPGALVKDGNVTISRLDSAGLVYNNVLSAPAEMRYNTVTTPQGGEYRLLLADGTKVWLNAGSSLHYPVSFTGRKREVWLSGEAYFEVKPLHAAGGQKVPFIVQVGSPSGNMKVEVLGTRFNISAYDDEQTIRTTLKEGSVRVSKGSESRLLKPGEQSGVNKQTGDIKVGPVDVEMALAWKNGLFHFDNTNITTIMREVSRWYDVEVVYATGDLDTKNFSGIVSRYNDVSALLKRLELTDAIHFRIEGRKITVMD